jgi:hypothetical protein
MKLASVSQWVTRFSTDRKSHLPKARWPGSRKFLTLPDYVDGGKLFKIN